MVRTGIRPRIFYIGIAFAVAYVSALHAEVGSAPVSGRQAVYSPPSGFWLLPSNHSGVLYGATSSSASWAIAQWGTSADLEAFDSESSTKNKIHHVILHQDGTYFLGQNTLDQPCENTYRTGRRLVKETDLFAVPNNPRNNPRYPSAVLNDTARLSNVNHVFHHIRVRPADISSETYGCKISQTALISAVVLTNPAARQGIFYQLRLAVYKTGPSRTRITPPGWFFTGKNVQSGASGQFGFGDNITSYGKPFAEAGKWNEYQVDLLPKLKALIVQGAQYGLDQDLSHWGITGTYHGLATMGRGAASADWGGFELAVD